jgi:DNA polymerase elongation subunit (family B)
MYSLLEKVLFLDIETVPQKPNFEALEEIEQQFWTKKAYQLSKNEEGPAELYQRAGIYAEFGKIVCISIGRISGKSSPIFHLQSFMEEDEKLLLQKFKKFLETQQNKLLCAHNGKEFDFPYIARRMLINYLTLPKLLNLAGKKPWEIPHLDTLELWKFGDYKHYTSLDLLAHIFRIPLPKKETNGEMVFDLWWNKKDKKRIRDYCEQDTLTVAKLYCAFNHISIFEQDHIEYIR